jgi:hypothetical protein
MLRGGSTRPIKKDTKVYSSKKDTKVYSSRILSLELHYKVVHVIKTL